MRRLKRLTKAEYIALQDLKRRVAKVFTLGGVKGNPAVDRVTIFPKDADSVIAMNRFLSRAVMLLVGKEKIGFRQEEVNFVIGVLETFSGLVRSKLMVPRPISKLVISGPDAQIYYTILEWARARKSIARKSYIETSSDVKQATDEADRALWIIGSILNVGHPPR